MKISYPLLLICCAVHGATMSAFNHSFDLLHWLTFALIILPYFAARLEK